MIPVFIDYSCKGPSITACESLASHVSSYHWSHVMCFHSQSVLEGKRKNSVKAKSKHIKANQSKLEPLFVRLAPVGISHARTSHVRNLSIHPEVQSPNASLSHPG